ncbi:MAG TPA: hypothetical protein VHO90_04210, partial [Bacteroidales bacterium]|nr:hypothetical protein [Bacteroidales bacterium]
PQAVDSVIHSLWIALDSVEEQRYSQPQYNARQRRFKGQCTAVVEGTTVLILKVLDVYPHRFSSGFCI